MKDTISGNTNRKNLFQLLCLRLIAIFGQIATILFAYYFLHIKLPLTAMFLVVLSLMIINCISFYRYKSQKNISDKSLFIELLFDVTALTAQLYFSGGISNPFISLFLLQVIISAILLRAIYAWLIAALTILCYIILSFNYQELHAFHHHKSGGHESGDFFNLHLHGMLISYIFSAILLLIFVTKIIKNLKEGDQKINLLKQQSLEKEQVIRMGLLATGAAHELSTPLSTIAVILGDWKKINLKKDLLEDIEVIESQLSRCKKILSEILTDSGKTRAEEARLMKVKEVFDELIKEWSNSRKPQNLIYNFYGENIKEIIFDNILSQAFFNIFDNALEASPNFVSVNIKVMETIVSIIIEDHGKGFSDYILKEIGKPNITTKNSSGLGLFLAINSFDRIGGKLEIKNLTIGARVIVTIPLKNL